MIAPISFPTPATISQIELWLISQVLFVDFVYLLIKYEGNETFLTIVAATVSTICGILAKVM